MQDFQNYVFGFHGSHCDWTGKPDKKFLGGKGAGLVQMVRDGLNVPPGFTITTEVCNAYLAASVEERGVMMNELMLVVSKRMELLTDYFGFRPLVSVRSGAPISMPGMMDTILNVGLTNSYLSDWKDRIGGRAAVDSRRRLIQMLGSTGYGVPMEVFDFRLAKAKKEAAAKSDTDLTEAYLHVVCSEYQAAFEKNKGYAFPVDDAGAQLRVAIEAVFKSWMNDRAVEYRELNKIDPAMGTAVTVQAMVFGNMGDDSGTGVLFSRNPSTGEKAMMGEFLQNAQGEDVVAGIRTPLDIYLMGDVTGPTFKTEHEKNLWPAIYFQLSELCDKLEKSYSDMVDVEFTVQKGQLYVLQSRTGKRSARAAFKIAVDQVNEKLITKKEALKRLTVEQYKVVRRPMVDPKCKLPPNLKGLPACPGIVGGKPVFSAKEAINCSEPCILVTHETNPNDIAGMAKAVGILTQTGGATSHAAVVARAMDKTCITGCTDLDIADMKAKKWKRITIDGATGHVWFQVEVPVLDSSDSAEVKTVTEWCQAVLGTCDVAPVDLGMDKPHRVMAAYWWGQEEVADAVLDGLAELPSRQHVALDLRGPSSFASPTDAILVTAFGADEEDLFPKRLYGKLKHRAKELQGLRLLNVEMDYEHPLTMAKLGFEVEGMDGMQMVPKAAPAEYAAFTVLSR